eukprot:231618_1
MVSVNWMSCDIDGISGWNTHKDNTELNTIMESSTKHHDHNFTKQLQQLQLTPLESTKKKQIISLLDSTDDEMDAITKKRRNYHTKSRPYTSRRQHVRMSKRLTSFDE